ncbi:hypothetical protein J3458_004212 [Metarhizium acridum]|uniref:uncharacterized protein n=1 Tax=Metarhizium acridum TaxID=92637 RepID=UPI001C6BFDE5|nr:hypothetical protein J3458_004212 [Metarhizium acridum]
MFPSVSYLAALQSVVDPPKRTHGLSFCRECRQDIVVRQTAISTETKKKKRNRKRGVFNSLRPKMPKGGYYPLMRALCSSAPRNLWSCVRQLFKAALCPYLYFVTITLVFSGWCVPQDGKGSSLRGAEEKQGFLAQERDFRVVVPASFLN